MAPPVPFPLASGADARISNRGGELAVVCVNGGRAAPVPGTWSASLEWLVARLAPRLPQVSFVEVRYRVRSWQRLDLCVEDALAAVAAAGAGRTLLLGFSMGGAVAVRIAATPGIDAVLGLAPWLPERLDVSPLRGKRLDVLHGSLDRNLPGVPGVSARLSRAGWERALAAGSDGTYTLIRGALHAIARRCAGAATAGEDVGATRRCAHRGVRKGVMSSPKARPAGESGPRGARGGCLRCPNVCAPA